MVVLYPFTKRKMYRRFSFFFLHCKHILEISSVFPVLFISKMLSSFLSPHFPLKKKEEKIPTLICVCVFVWVGIVVYGMLSPFCGLYKAAAHVCVLLAIMSLKGTLTILFAGIWLLCMFCQTDAYGPLSHACCVKYTRTPLDLKVIKGFAVQSSREVCRIDAIIFLTKRNKKVCASTEDEWVRKVLVQLSNKIKKLSKHHPNQVNHTATWKTNTNA